jgi:hypothetical protein
LPNENKIYQFNKINKHLDSLGTAKKNGQNCFKRICLIWPNFCQMANELMVGQKRFWQFVMAKSKFGNFDFERRRRASDRLVK